MELSAGLSYTSQFYKVVFFYPQKKNKNPPKAYIPQNAFLLLHWCNKHLAALGLFNCCHPSISVRQGGCLS